MKAIDVAKWFLGKQPGLRNGYIDENTKLNKLLYFSNLMYYAVFGKELIDDQFEAWKNGPVSRSVYRDYRYNGLSSTEDLAVDINDEKVTKILEIINLVYGRMSAKELSDESHKSPVWNEASQNEKLKFNKISSNEKNLMNQLYNLYNDFDLENLNLEKINGNYYLYDKTDFQITDEVIEELESMNHQSEVFYIEQIDGELVIS